MLNQSIFPRAAASALAVTMAAVLAAPAHGAELTIAVDGVASADGRVLVALFDSADSFPVKPVRAAAVAAVAGQVRLLLADLPAGDYAYIVYHDANSNNRLDMNSMGMPVEDFAFSNNAMGAGRAPGFEAARVSVPAAGLHTTVNLR